VFNIQCVPLATESGISLIILPPTRIFQRLKTHTTYTFLFISHTTNVILFKFRCNIFIGVRITKEMPGSIASGTHCMWKYVTSWVFKINWPTLKFRIIHLAHENLNFRTMFYNHTVTTKEYIIGWGFLVTDDCREYNSEIPVNNLTSGTCLPK